MGDTAAVSNESLAQAYLGAVRQVLDRIEHTQMDAIAQAADMIVDSLLNDGVVHLHDTGHLVQREAVHRAGGLLLLTALEYGFSVHNAGPATTRRHSEAVRPDRVLGLAELALDNSKVRPGDVLIFGSVSGRNARDVALALAAKARGVKLVAITSVAHSLAEESTHPSRKRLFEVADVTIDNCGIVGDAALEVESLDARFGPTSGIAAAAIVWMLSAAVIERLVAAGKKPHVYKTVNLADGAEFNRRAEEEFKETGV